MEVRSLLDLCLGAVLCHPLSVMNTSPFCFFLLLSLPFNFLTYLSDLSHISNSYWKSWSVLVYLNIYRDCNFFFIAYLFLDLGVLGKWRDANFHVLSSLYSRLFSTGYAPASWAFHRTCCCVLLDFANFVEYRWPSQIQTLLIKTSLLPFTPSSFQGNDILSSNFETITSFTVNVFRRFRNSDMV